MGCGMAEEGKKKEIKRLGVNIDGVGEEEGKREKEKGKENSLKTT